ncbi:MAG: AarF/ABC1/UbiB kinase family protein [Chloroflexi bacterium]|nr:AarF/ABC1/UbiB kinase family protein [Chloroflexota bacterium]
MYRLLLRARYWRIVRFFAGVTLNVVFWEMLVRRIGLDFLARRTRAARLRKIAVRFRALAIRMGGVMIKVGQFLSARLDVLPPEITEELAGLQDEVPPEPFDSIRRLAESEFSVPLDQVFESFDPVPLAAASLGQVHRARLNPAEAAQAGFEKVVVKIQRPNIETLVEVDLSAIRVVGNWLTYYRPVSDRADVPAIIEEFAATIHEEIDYLAEGRNAGTFHDHFREDSFVHVPRVVWPRTTVRVLTLEDVYAIKITDYDSITAAGIDRAKVAERLLGTYLRQIFENGFFHADPHPGNLFVTPVDGTNEDGSPRWKLTFVDFGMVGRLPNNLAEGLREAVISVGLRDSVRLVQAYRTLGVLVPGANTKLLEEAGAQLFDRFWGMNMSELRRIRHDDMVRFGMQFRELMYSMPFQLPENLLLLGRTIAILSGMCTGLDPEFNLWTQLAPYATRLAGGDEEGWFEKWLDEIGGWLRTLAAVPGRAERVLGRMERGELNVQIPMVNLQISHLERSVNRLTGTILFMALLIAGAMLHSSDEVLGMVLMGVSALVLFFTMFLVRGHRPW